MEVKTVGKFRLDSDWEKKVFITCTCIQCYSMYMQRKYELMIAGVSFCQQEGRKVCRE